MSIQENMIKLRSIYGVTQGELAAIADVTNGAVSQWEHGFSEPRLSTIQKIADHFGISKSHIIEEGGMDGIDPVTRSVCPLPSTPVSARPFSKTAPVLGRIAACDPSQVYKDIEYREAPAKLVEKYPQGFFLQVSGDSMDKVIPDGAFVFISGLAEEVHSGDIAAVKVNGDEATIKRVQFFDGLVVLAPESTNPDHKRRIIDETNPDAPAVRVLGKALWVDYALVSF